MFHVPGKYTGGEGPGYAWTQTQSEVELRAPLPAGAEGSVRCTFSARKLALSWADAAAPLDAELSALVAPDDCLWSVEEEAGAKTVVVSLRKQVKAVWSRLLESDAEPAEAPRLIDGAERSTPKTKAELLADAKARAKGALDEELGKAKLHMVEGRSGEVMRVHMIRSSGSFPFFLGPQSFFASFLKLPTINHSDRVQNVTKKIFPTQSGKKRKNWVKKVRGVRSLRNTRNLARPVFVTVLVEFS